MSDELSADSKPVSPKAEPVHKLSDLDEMRENIARGNLRKLAKTNGHAVLIANLTVGEYSAVQWAQRMTPDAGGLDGFMRMALRERVRLIARGEIERGRDVPQIVAEWLAKD